MAMNSRFTKKQNVLGMLQSTKDNVFSQEEFKALVKYERTRSDRNGSIFSITVFRFNHKNQASLESYILKISQYTRSIDCVGWIDDGKIAVLLPDTLKEGAEAFGRKLKVLLEETEHDRFSTDIYTYPEHWLSNGDENDSNEEKLEREMDSLKNSVEFLFVNKAPAWKRALDITGASMLLFLTSPILLFMSLYIKMVSPGPIFFKQKRIGFKGIPFTFWKFRTMKFEDNQGFHGKHAQSFITNGDIPMEKLDGRDPRIILGGKLIRKSCIDELPQLWNVLRGDMSLVGPRPCIPYEAKEYLRWHTHRFDTVPGLSGLWQVSGKNKLTFKQMIRLDIAYCRNISFWGDLVIIFKTPLVILNMVFEAVLKKIDREVIEVASMPLGNLPERKAQ